MAVDAVDVEALRRDFEAHNGMPGLEILGPVEVDRAVRIFYRDGFVVVRDVLDADQVAFLRRGCEREAEEVIAAHPDGKGNRGTYRYSWGGASLTNSVLHREEWVMLVDLPPLTPIVTAIFGSSDYHVRRAAGDFCMPGAIEYQPLHSDINDHVGGFFDPRGITTIRDLPCPVVCCNFLAQDFTKTNGPTRQIPGTQHSRENIPGLAEEPLWMKYSTVCPAPAGVGPDSGHPRLARRHSQPDERDAGDSELHLPSRLGSASASYPRCRAKCSTCCRSTGAASANRWWRMGRCRPVIRSTVSLAARRICLSQACA